MVMCTSYVDGEPHLRHVRTVRSNRPDLIADVMPLDDVFEFFGQGDWHGHGCDHDVADKQPSCQLAAVIHDGVHAGGVCGSLVQ